MNEHENDAFCHRTSIKSYINAVCIINFAKRFDRTKRLTSVANNKVFPKKNWNINRFNTTLQQC